MKERLAILISGSGTTMAEIIKATQIGEVDLDIACVIASNSKAKGLEIACQLGINPERLKIISPLEFKEADGKVDRKAFGEALLQPLKCFDATVVTQNGWLPLTPEHIIDEYEDAMFNQHPGPVPEFGGKGMFGRRVHAARLLFVRMTKRDYWTEAIAQRVHRDFDQGAVVKSTRVDILSEDIVDDLQQRVLPAEHQVQIDLLKDVASGNIKEVTRGEMLVRPGEEQILFLEKKNSKNAIPKGMINYGNPRNQG